MNYLVDIALGELDAINGHMTCDGCGYAVECNNGDEIYYCDHEDRADDMGKLSLENLIETSPEWCPLRCKSNNDMDSASVKMESESYYTDKEGRSIKIKVPQPEYSSEIFS